ncbi:hypothetical protein JRO89_XS12G0004400 [Xanthoceras sorbifolium]|uniref:Disease resistance protein At4g27190-like leucine-rich repeats domain-containing protein n=1 Tax=Xanthoceras sorbifolium TaxID=99658 RepID=A0ABQ8HA60_9ROSI|nr:hypothetical protein JRO89_XS12G0004400 [Xanthoceras sorbifolium]
MLEIRNCKSIEGIINTGELRGEGKMVFPKLIKLQIKGLPNLTQFGSKISVEFSSMTQLSIEDCPKLKTFSFSSALTSGDIKQGEQVEEINWQDDIHPLFNQKLHLKHLPELTIFCNFAGTSIEWPSLAQLWIENCPKMHTFVSNSPPIDMPASKEDQMNSEENLHSRIQPLFDEKVQLPNLKVLDIRNMDNIRRILHHQHDPNSFWKLDQICVLDCHNLLNVFPSNMLGKLQKLGMLLVSNCISLEMIFEELKISSCMEEKNVAEEDVEVVPRLVFPQLTSLRLVDLPRLRIFYPGLYISEWPMLKTLRIWGCKKVERLTSEFQSLQETHGETPHENSIQQPLFLVDKVAFPNLEELSLEWNCIVNEMLNGNFSGYSCKIKILQLIDTTKETICPCFLLYTLPNIEELTVNDGVLEEMFTCEGLGCREKYGEELKIINCAILEAIIFTEEETIRNTLFPNLNELKLIDLPELKSFCNLAENAIELPSLAALWIEDCPNMQTFISNFTSADMLTSMDIQPLFDEKVQLPNLKFLRLDGMDKLRKIWHYQLTPDSFYKLDSFGVHNCHNVLNVFPSNMLGRLQKLDELWLTNCSSLDEIIEIQASGCGKTQAITSTQLTKLVLNYLPKLKHIWDMNSQGLLTCQNLLSIQVAGCESLKSIFPASVARSLLQLQELKINLCCMLEEIVAEEEQLDEAVPRFLFPQLTCLELFQLSSLKSFYPGSHISEWPALTNLEVWKCDKVETFSSEFSSFQVTQWESQHEMPMRQHLFLVDKVPFPNLESLALEWIAVKVVLREKLLGYSCKLKVLGLRGFHKETDVCLSCFLHKLPNLEKLRVHQGFFKEIFLCGELGCEDNHVEVPSKLSYLRLYGVSDSLHLESLVFGPLLDCVGCVVVVPPRAFLTAEFVNPDKGLTSSVLGPLPAVVSA